MGVAASAGVLTPRAAAENAAGCPPPWAEVRSRTLTPQEDATAGDGAHPADDGAPGLHGAPVRPGSDRRRHRSPEPGRIRIHPPRTCWLPVVTAPGSAVEQVLPDWLRREPAGQGWWGWTPEWGLSWLGPGSLHHLEPPPSRRLGAAAAPTVPRPVGSAPWPCCSRCAIRPRPTGKDAGRDPRAAPPESEGTWGGHWRRSDG